MEKSLVFNINGTGLNVDLVGIIGSTLMAIVVFAICYALSRKV
ncbi:F0F1 ATP synthase subunit A, partial [Lactobacillus delbrueckii subsp. bulgaricus]